MSVPFVPDIATRVVIRPGSTTEIVSTEKLSGSATVRTPTFTLGASIAGVGGNSQQITRLRAGNRDWRFAQASMWRLCVWAGSGDPRAVPITAKDFAPPVVVQSGTGFTLTWSDAVLGTIVGTGVFNASTGQTDLTFSVTLGVAVSGVYKTWAFDFPYHRVYPYRAAAKDSMQILTTDFGGRIWHDCTTPLIKATYPYGSPSRSPADVAYPSAGITASSPASMQFMALYDREVGAGLILRTNDQVGRLKEFSWEGRGDSVDIWVRHFPPNNLAATTMTSAYTTSLVPITGGADEICTWYREQLRASNDFRLARGRIRDASAATMPTTIRNGSNVQWFHIPAPAASNRASAIAAILQQVTRAAAEFGAGTWCFLYNHVSDGIPNDLPDVSPVSADVQSLVSSLVAAGVRVVLYHVLGAWDPTSAWWAANPSAGNYVCLNPDQSPVDSGFAGVTLRSANPIHANAILGIQTQFALIAASFSTPANVGGYYLDEGGGKVVADHRASLLDAQKGSGAGTWIPAVRPLLDSLKTYARTINPEALFATEMPFEDLLDKYDVFAPAVVNLLEFASSWPAFRKALGDYSLFMDFQGNSTLDSRTATVLLAASVELFRWRIARIVAAGALPSYAGPLIADAAVQPYVIPFFVQPGEPHYDLWLAYQKPINDFTKACILPLDYAIGGLRKYFRGRMLPSFDDSWSAYVERKSFLEAYAEYVAGLSLPGPRCEATVWLTDEELGNPIGIPIWNFRATPEVCHIRMDPLRYASYLGGKRYLVRNSGGVRTLVKECPWGVDYEALIPPASVVHYELVVAPPGQ